MWGREEKLSEEQNHFLIVYKELKMRCRGQTYLPHFKEVFALLCWSFGDYLWSVGLAMGNDLSWHWDDVGKTTCLDLCGVQGWPS